MVLMGANQSKSGQRPRFNKSNPPPPYSKGVTATANLKHDGPQKLGTNGLPVNAEQPGEQCTAELVAKLESLERAVSELQRADQLQVIEKEKQSLKEQKRNLEEQKSSLEKEKSHWEKEKKTLEEKNRSLEKDKKSLEEQNNRLEGRSEERQSALERSYETRRKQTEAINKISELNGVLNHRMRELRDDLQRVSTEALKAKALLGKGNDQAVSVESCHCTQHPGT
jgi:chromosome segregation ATPase